MRQFSVHTLETVDIVLFKKQLKTQTFALRLSEKSQTAEGKRLQCNRRLERQLHKLTAAIFTTQSLLSPIVHRHQRLKHTLVQLTV